MEKRMLNLNEAAEFTGVSRSTIYSMVKNNEIPYKKLRKRIVFHPDVLDNWLREGCNETS